MSIESVTRCPRCGQSVFAASTRCPGCNSPLFWVSYVRTHDGGQDKDPGVSPENTHCGEGLLSQNIYLAGLAHDK